MCRSACRRRRSSTARATGCRRPTKARGLRADSSPSGGDNVHWFGSMFRSAVPASHRLLRCSLRCAVCCTWTKPRLSRSGGDSCVVSSTEPCRASCSSPTTSRHVRVASSRSCTVLSAGCHRMPLLSIRRNGATGRAGTRHNRSPSYGSRRRCCCRRHRCGRALCRCCASTSVMRCGSARRLRWACSLQRYGARVPGVSLRRHMATKLGGRPRREG